MNTSPTILADTTGQFFESLYEQNPDPWNFAVSAYERRRYATTLSGLLRPYYQTAFEPGCSVGELTAELAARCERVIATDIAPSAVARARTRCARFPNVEISCSDLSISIPKAPLDLVVLSEIGYYFTERALRGIAAELAAQLQPGGEFVAIHWLGNSKDHVLRGDVVHGVLREALPLQWAVGARYSGFRIDTWVSR
jgi:protein-L-isoaspartate O-methyltransferase